MDVCLQKLTEIVYYKNVASKIEAKERGWEPNSSIYLLEVP